MSVKVCSPKAHSPIYSNLPRFAFRHSCFQALIAGVCAFTFASSVLATSVTAQTLENDGATTEEELIEKAIQDQLQFDAAPGANNKHFCQIILVNDGQLHEIPGMARLSSKGAGGRPGIAQVTATNSRYRVSLDAPLGFTYAPTDGNTGVSMSASYIGYGSASFTETPGNIQQKIKRGTTRIEAHLVADRSGTPFPAGNYAAELTLRCE